MLRDDIRRSGAQLGATLARQEGEGFLALVEEVRAAAKAVRAGSAPAGDLRDRLAAADLPTAIRPGVTMTTTRVIVTYTAELSEETGATGCVNATTTLRLELDQPLGDRVLVDGSCLDPAVVGGAECGVAGVRWPLG
ncbi:MAG TPA: hypothetical protein VK507_23095 [Iamia sp.]|nr:hypothetical protein [Iamia sp.]